MEAGELDYCDDSQAFYAGEIVGLPQAPCEESRLRCFGGTSGHWEGKCRAFEAEDFAPRPWMPLSGWPIGLAELAPHAPEAAAILDLDACENPPDGPLAEPSDRFRHVVWRMSPPTRFGDKYRAEVIAAPRITLGVRATLVDLRLSDDARTVATGVFRAWGGLEPTFTVTARAFALCMGGLENARPCSTAGAGSRPASATAATSSAATSATGRPSPPATSSSPRRSATRSATSPRRPPSPPSRASPAARWRSSRAPCIRATASSTSSRRRRAASRRGSRGCSTRSATGGQRPATTAASRRWRSASRPTATPSPSSASRSSNG